MATKATSPGTPLHEQILQVGRDIADILAPDGENITTVVTIGTVGASAVPVAALANRKGAIFCNSSASTITLGGTPVSVGNGIILNPGAVREMGLGPNSIIWGISPDNIRQIRVIERS